MFTVAVSAWANRIGETSGFVIQLEQEGIRRTVYDLDPIRSKPPYDSFDLDPLIRPSMPVDTVP